MHSSIRLTPNSAKKIQVNLFVSFPRAHVHIANIPLNFGLQERERLRQEKRDEKRLNKERKLEQRRLELEIARELKKPNEDMCLSDHKVL